jgi:hypothetical protein
MFGSERSVVDPIGIGPMIDPVTLCTDFGTRALVLGIRSPCLIPGFAICQVGFDLPNEAQLAK